MPSPLPDEEILDALRSAAPTPPPNLLERWQFPGPPVPVARKTRPWVLGAAAIALSVVVFVFLPGSVLQPTPTFAQVQETMLRLDTVSWNERWPSSYILYPDGAVVRQPQSLSTRHWADLRLPAIASAGKRVRTVFRAGQTLRVTQKTNSLSTYQTLSSYQVFPWSSPTEQVSTQGSPNKKTPREEIVHGFVLPRTDSNEGWSSEPTVLGGRKLLRLKRVVPQQPSRGPWKPERLTYIIWIDPHTRRVFKRETRERLRHGSRVIESVMVCDDFRYNETPPAGFFDVAPRIGANYVYVPQPERKIKPEDQQAMEAVVRKAEKAWNAGDASAYLSLWRFDYPTSGSSRAAQLAAIRNPKRYRWPEAARSYQAGVRSSGVYTHHAGDAFPPKDPVEFGVGFWGLLKESDGFKIVRVLVPNL